MKWQYIVGFLGMGLGTTMICQLGFSHGTGAWISAGLGTLIVFTCGNIMGYGGAKEIAESKTKEEGV